MKKWLLVIVAALSVLVLGLAGCSAGLAATATDVPPGSQQNTGIWVTGEGKVTVVPDLAIVNVGVEVQMPKVLDAQQAAAKAMEDVVNQLKQLGIAEKDIQTQQYSIYQVTRYDGKTEVLDGYRVSNLVTVKVRKIADAGAVLDAVTTAGGDYTRVNGISFTVDDPKPYYEQVRKLAVQDAAARAQQLADASGVTLGRINYISESNVYYPVMRSAYDSASGAVPAPSVVTPITAGEMEISLTVQVVYSIAQ